MESEDKRAPWRRSDHFRNLNGHQKKRMRYRYSGNVQKVRYDKMQKPIAAKRFKYLIKKECSFISWCISFITGGIEKVKKGSTEYFQLPPSRFLVEEDHYSVQSEPFSFSSSPSFGMEAKAKASVILNLAEMDTLPPINVLACDGFKLTPTVEKQTAKNISNLFSEGDFVRHYLTETNTTHESGCEQ
ncbi:hypothetical protein NPIL_265941 [Nephila pilipes]|uniref:Uncharacterized protein n=1 Tax=Nephila pilipes TaxID=299642 RepID=A0A8X6NJ97_NEPPI|nr:hypothetical protein NPIL_265941 [Nephila pilipes]